MEIIVRNIRRKMRLSRAIEWFNKSHAIVYVAERRSSKGTDERIYLLQAGINNLAHIGDTLQYSNYTGKKLAGKGTMTITNIINATIMNIIPAEELEDEVLNVWVVISNDY